MITLQALRRSRGITLIDLALLSGVPVRTIASIEYGLVRLDRHTREQLAHVFGIPPETLQPGAPPALQQDLRRRLARKARAATPAVAAALATAVLLAPTPGVVQYGSTAPAAPIAAKLPSAPPRQAALQPAEALSPAAQLAAVPLPAVGLVAGTEPVALARVQPLEPPALPATGSDPALVGGHKRAESPARAPGFVPAPDGAPYGCPIATSGRVVVTQGYGVGTHAPAESWGALDLGVDGDGDGYAEPGSSFGSLVFTPHGGVSRVAAGGWPGGNYVRVTNGQTGWVTAYAHLDQVFVADGQQLEPGTVIGTLGNTGYSTAAHLHYEVWRGGVNVDPSPYVLCG
ncbi:MAG: hypothetical protein RLZZ387_4297 [Chloroflexota bacterium]